MTKYLSMAAFAVFILAGWGYKQSLSINQLKSINANLTLNNIAYGGVVKLTTRYYKTTLKAERDKNNDLLTSEKRVEEMEASLKSDSRFDVLLPDIVRVRLHERADSFYKPAAATE